MCLCLKENPIFETLPLERCKHVSINNKLRINSEDTLCGESEELLNITILSEVCLDYFGKMGK